MLLLFAWDSLAKVRKFMAKPELKETIGQAGVIGAPEVYFLERYDRGKMVTTVWPFTNCHQVMVGIGELSPVHMLDLLKCGNFSSHKWEAHMSRSISTTNSG